MATRTFLSMPASLTTYPGLTSGNVLIVAEDEKSQICLYIDETPNDPSVSSVRHYPGHLIYMDGVKYHVLHTVSSFAYLNGNIYFVDSGNLYMCSFEEMINPTDTVFQYDHIDMGSTTITHLFGGVTKIYFSGLTNGKRQVFDFDPIQQKVQVLYDALDWVPSQIFEYDDGTNKFLCMTQIVDGNTNLHYDILGDSKETISSTTISEKVVYYDVGNSRFINLTTKKSLTISITPGTSGEQDSVLVTENDAITPITLSFPSDHVYDVPQESRIAHQIIQAYHVGPSTDPLYMIDGSNEIVGMTDFTDSCQYFCTMGNDVYIGKGSMVILAQKTQSGYTSVLKATIPSDAPSGSTTTGPIITRFAIVETPFIFGLGVTTKEVMTTTTTNGDTTTTESVTRRKFTIMSGTGLMTSWSFHLTGDEPIDIAILPNGPSHLFFVATPTRMYIYTYNGTTYVQVVSTLSDITGFDGSDTILSVCPSISKYHQYVYVLVKKGTTGYSIVSFDQLGEVRNVNLSLSGTQPQLIRTKESNIYLYGISSDERVEVAFAAGSSAYDPYALTFVRTPFNEVVTAPVPEETLVPEALVEATVAPKVPTPTFIEATLAPTVASTMVAEATATEATATEATATEATATEATATEAVVASTTITATYADTTSSSSGVTYTTTSTSSNHIAESVSGCFNVFTIIMAIVGVLIIVGIIVLIVHLARKPPIPQMMYPPPPPGYAYVRVEHLPEMMAHPISTAPPAIPLADYPPPVN